MIIVLVYRPLAKLDVESAFNGIEVFDVWASRQAAQDQIEAAEKEFPGWEFCWREVKV